ncbi:hypothetical protein HHK36_019160 [Tetracentron sinense]|uniref:PLAC8 family protein n=1 Tax=Tetracentron sinense TaxID=13715 RepID=A0A835D9C1_TETSI|nr:hypothetical protein HHK36_019160 [Tetracentron sinense]
MANPEESSPLLIKQGDRDSNAKHVETPATPTKSVVPESGYSCGYGVEWTADGLPFGNGSVVGEPVARSQWDSSLLACLGRNDEFCSSDLEVCLLGSVAPCMLYGSNVERLGSDSGAYANHCLSYTGLYLLGSSLFGSNCMAPWFSYPSRTAIRRKFNLEASYLSPPLFGTIISSLADGRLSVLDNRWYKIEDHLRSQRKLLTLFSWFLWCKQGSCEAFSRSCGCCGSIIEDEVQREQCESACDFATHFFCHTCSLCQEGRELRRRLPHPGFNGRPFLVMTPPMEQTMGHRGA